MILPTNWEYQEEMLEMPLRDDHLGIWPTSEVVSSDFIQRTAETDQKGKRKTLHFKQKVHKPRDREPPTSPVDQKTKISQPEMSEIAPPRKSQPKFRFSVQIIG